MEIKKSPSLVEVRHQMYWTLTKHRSFLVFSNPKSCYNLPLCYIKKRRNPQKIRSCYLKQESCSQKKRLLSRLRCVKSIARRLNAIGDVSCPVTLPCFDHLGLETILQERLFNLKESQSRCITV